MNKSYYLPRLKLVKCLLACSMFLTCASGSLKADYYNDVRLVDETSHVGRMEGVTINVGNGNAYDKDVQHEQDEKKAYRLVGDQDLSHLTLWDLEDKQELVLEKCDISELSEEILKELPNITFKNCTYGSEDLLINGKKRNGKLSLRGSGKNKSSLSGSATQAYDRFARRFPWNLSRNISIGGSGSSDQEEGKVSLTNPDAVKAFFERLDKECNTYPDTVTSIDFGGQFIRFNPDESEWLLALKNLRSIEGDANLSLEIKKTTVSLLNGEKAQKIELVSGLPTHFKLINKVDLSNEKNVELQLISCLTPLKLSQIPSFVTVLILPAEFNLKNCTEKLPENVHTLRLKGCNLSKLNKEMLANVQTLILEDCNLSRLRQESLVNIKELVLRSVDLQKIDKRILASIPDVIFDNCTYEEEGKGVDGKQRNGSVLLKLKALGTWDSETLQALIKKFPKDLAVELNFSQEPNEQQKTAFSEIAKKRVGSFKINCEQAKPTSIPEATKEPESIPATGTAPNPDHEIHYPLKHITVTNSKIRQTLDDSDDLSNCTRETLKSIGKNLLVGISDHIDELEIRGCDLSKFSDGIAELIPSIIFNDCKLENLSITGKKSLSKLSLNIPSGLDADTVGIFAQFIQKFPKHLPVELQTPYAPDNEQKAALLQDRTGDIKINGDSIKFEPMPKPAVEL